MKFNKIPPPEKGGGIKNQNMGTLPEKVRELGWFIKWGAISKEYFGLSRSWIYQRLGGYDGNGNECGFTDEQKEKLKEALLDLSQKLAEAAEEI